MEIAWHKIIGHTRAIARLRTLLREGRLPHALLFSGPEGVGKLRVARALAASLLCLGEGELASGGKGCPNHPHRRNPPDADDCGAPADAFPSARRYHR